MATPERRDNGRRFPAKLAAAWGRTMHRCVDVVSAAKRLISRADSRAARNDPTHGGAMIGACRSRRGAAVARRPVVSKGP